MTKSEEQSEESNVGAELKKLLQEMLTSVDEAPEGQKRRLLSSLKELNKEERRRHPRKPCSIPVTVGTFHVSTEHIHNISVGGVFIETSAPFPFSPGDQVTLTFGIPNQKRPVIIAGKVVWISTVGVGVEFTTPPSKELREVIESL